MEGRCGYIDLSMVSNGRFFMSHTKFKDVGNYTCKLCMDVGVAVR